jgi:hypothetical protein
MPLRVGCHRAVQIFYTDYSRNTLETTRFGFDKGGGGITPVRSYGETLARAGSLLKFHMQLRKRTELSI